MTKFHFRGFFMFKKKLSLMAKLMISVNLMTMIGIMSLTGFLAYKSFEDGKESVKDEIFHLTSSVALTSAEYVWNLNNEVLNNITSELIKNEKIDSVVFYDTKKNKMSEALRKEAKAGTGFSISQNILYGAKKDVIGNVEITYNHNSLKQEFKHDIFISLAGIAIAQIFFFIVLYFVLRKTIYSIADIAEDLKALATSTSNTSEDVKTISEAVSSSTTEQASSIQETVATLDEITSMVNTSVESAVNSSYKAEESHKIASEGKKVVQEMIKSMQEINNSNKEIVDEISRGNERISGIVKVIQEISEKTQVINDIVFQTKLLSFNASVEAARAGEHGKGFAVVAEEVGNLAQMSGKASTEIADILNESIQTVNSIIIETNTNVKRLIEVGNNKVESGVKIADRCGKVLDDVVDNAGLVKTLMSEVSVASKEQAEGVKNISNAMNQLDQSTHSNAESANKSYHSSAELKEQAERLNNTVKDLEIEIFGTNSALIQKSSPSKVEKKLTKSAKAPEVKKKDDSKVLPFLKKETAKTEPKKVEVAKTKNTKVEVKKVMPTGAASKKVANAIPSHDDPRFEEI